MSAATHRHICAAILREAAPALLIASRDRPWASATFSGARHWFTLDVPADLAGDIVCALPEAEFALPGQLVADLAVTARQPMGPMVRLSVEALTVQAC